MAREHVEFADPATMQWTDTEVAGFPDGTREKVLSEDAETDASTRLLAVPSGERPEATAVAADTELFVVSGGLRVNDRQLGRYGYAFVPEGATVSCETADRCRVLYMPDGPATAGSPTDATPELVSTTEMDWEQPQTEGFPAGAARKSLHYDEDTGAATWLLGVLPGWRETRIEVHPVVEEAYQVQGSMQADQGVFSAGKYFWRPPGIPHGPFSSEMGCLTLFRTDGELETDYVGDTADVDFLQ
jgi:hypothetical protein